MIKSFLSLCLALTAAGAASAAEPAFDPRSFRADVEGPLTRVFVLGSPHLSGAPDDFDAGTLGPLLERLAMFEPSVIAVENLSGESVHALKAYEGVYPEVADTYGRRILEMAKIAGGELGFDMPAAEAEARRFLAALPEEPSPAQRRRLAALFAASGDPFSAAVQWKRLPENERKAADGVTTALVDSLNGFAVRRNESILIGAELAARLGHERIYPTDDHSADDIVIPLYEQLSAFLKNDPGVADVFDNPVMQQLAGAAQKLRTPQEALATYRMVNSDEMIRADPEIQWRFFLDRAMPDAIGRKRIAEWEARNLRMVAHIREAFANHPGENVLVIVGSAHKPYFDAYLDMMHDVDVVHASEVLE